MLRNVEAPTRPRLECRRETGLILRCDRKVGNPFQTKQGSRPSGRDQEGRRGSEEVVRENHGVPLEGISHASKVMLKLLQARLQEYMNRELPDVQA